MSMEVSGATPQNGKPDVIRRKANFHPSILGDRFINYTSKDKEIHARKVREVEELKEKARKELLASASHLSQQLEIEEALEHMYATYNDSNNVEDDDIYNVAICFRLLRQQGFNVSCDTFNKFKDKDGQFKESLASNVKDMLAFYEAAHLRMHGEGILDEALEFTTTHLKSTVSAICNLLAKQVTRALKQPLHKGIPWLEA
uniref:Terpene synthase N-terminal domain-containing protein n=1 Tax=Quercus lobata TaxID=97700 RepID=A0A7N2MQA0_QUELO